MCRMEVAVVFLIQLLSRYITCHSIALTAILPFTLSSQTSWTLSSSLRLPPLRGRGLRRWTVVLTPGGASLPESSYYKFAPPCRASKLTTRLQDSRHVLIIPCLEYRQCFSLQNASHPLPRSIRGSDEDKEWIFGVAPFSVGYVVPLRLIVVVISFPMYSGYRH